ncbi:hypothetical protein C6P42_004609, partial [Pichia californica]
MNISKEDNKLLKKYLVGREDAGRFSVTKYRYSPMELPMSELLLDKGSNCLFIKGFKTTPLLSLYGIYVHSNSKKIVVKCVGKTSYCIPKMNEYYFNDVIIRSGCQVGKARAGVDYWDGGGGFHFDFSNAHEITTGADLCREMAQHEEYLFGDTDKGCFAIPFLPIFLGYIIPNKGNDEIIPVNFGSVGYKQELRQAMGNRYKFRLFQRVEEGKIRFVGVENVNGDDGFGGELDWSVKHALRYRVNKRTFLPRVLR